MKKQNNMRNIFTTRNIIIAAAVIILAGGILWYLSLPNGAGQEKKGIGEILGGLFPNSADQKPIAIPPAGENKLPEGSAVGEGNSYQLVKEAVSGATFYKGKVRYIEKATGHLYEIGADGNNKTRISNTTIPGIFDVKWSPLGNRAILKYISNGELNTLSVTFNGSSTQSIFLPGDIKNVTFSPKGDRIAYIQVAGDDGSLITATPDNKTKTVRLKMPITSWRLDWPEANNIYLLSASSAYLQGILYRLNVSSGAFTKIFGPSSGLAAKTNGADVILSFSDPFERTLYSSIFNISSGKLGQLEFKTFPDKCAWSKKSKDTALCAVPITFSAGIYPDDWYKGKFSPADALVKISLKSLAINSITIPQAVDANELFLSDDETILFFLDKSDGSLWRVKLP